MARTAAAAAAFFALALVGAAMFSADDTAAVVAQQRFLTDSFRRMLWLEVMQIVLPPYPIHRVVTLRAVNCAVPTCHLHVVWACLGIQTGPSLYLMTYAWSLRPRPRRKSLISS